MLLSVNRECQVPKHNSTDSRRFLSYEGTTGRIARRGANLAGRGCCQSIRVPFEAILEPHGWPLVAGFAAALGQGHVAIAPAVPGGGVQTYGGV